MLQGLLRDFCCFLSLLLHMLGCSHSAQKQEQVHNSNATPLSLSHWSLLLCMGVQASIFPESFNWLNHCASFARRGEPISPISFSWVADISHTPVGLAGIYYHFPELQRSEAQSEESYAFIYYTAEAVLKVQLQRRAGKNHV